jgi:hypothetical protein
MRVILAVAAAFCLAFPLSAGAASGGAVNSDLSAARRHQTVGGFMCPTKFELTYQVCQCQVSGGYPTIYYPACLVGPQCPPAVVVCQPGVNR